MNLKEKTQLSPRVLHAVFALLVVAAIIISRQPVLFTEPRFWWDEGRIGYAYAYHNGLWEALFAAHRGYYNFINKLAAFFEILFFSVEKAPFMGTYMAFFVQLLPHAVVWGGRSPYWDTPLKRAIVSAIIMFDTQDCSIWLSAVTSHFHLALVAFLLLAEEWQGRSRRCEIVYGALLFVCGISGVMSCFLMPVFFFKYYFDRSRLGRVLLGALLAGCAVQGMAFLKSIGTTGIGTRRFSYYEDISHFLLYYALGSVYIVFRDVPRFPMNPAAHELLLLREAVGWLVPLCMAALVAVSVYFGQPLKWRERVLFIGTFYYLSLLCLITAIVDYNLQERYFYVSNVILMLMVQQSMFAAAQQFGLRNLLACMLVALVVVVGAARFYRDYACWRPEWNKWEDEVAKWRIKPNHSMLVHPIDPLHVRSVELRPRFNLHNVP